MRVLVFEVRGRPYALPADAIRHVDDVAEVTPLPFVPRYVDGLVALGGKVLPQLDLGAFLTLPGENLGAGQLVVLATGETECALRVGAAWRMVRVDDGDIAPIDAANEDNEADDTERGEVELGEAEPVTRDRLAGMFRYQDQSVFLLRPERIGLEGMGGGPAARRGQPVLLGEIDDGSAAVGHRSREEVIPSLAVRVGKEHYAFPLLRVLEVYQDNALTPLPDSPGYVGGISVLRGQPRLVLSLARLLGLPVTEPETAMVATTARGLLVVFQCNALVGIRRFPESRRDTTAESTAGVDSFLIGDDGTVTILLEPDSLLTDQAVRRLRAFLPRVRATDDTPVTAKGEDRRMLLVHVGSEICAVDIGCIERVANYAPPTGLPKVAGLRVGMIEIGGRVLPTADLGLAFGEALGETAGAYVVVRTNRADAFGLWALAVGKVERLVRVPQASILGTPGAGASSGRLLCGVGRVGERLVNLLDVNALEDGPDDRETPGDATESAGELVA